MGILSGAKAVGKAGFGIKRFMIVGFIFFFILFLLIHATIIGIQERSLQAALEDIGPRALEPVLTLKLESQEVLDNQGVFDDSKGKIRGVGGVLQTYSSIGLSLYVIVGWIWALMWASSWVISGDTSRRTLNFILALGLFYIIQTGFLLFTLRQSDLAFSEILWIPIGAFFVFFKALPFLIKPINNMLPPPQNITVNGTI